MSGDRAESDSAVSREQPRIYRDPWYEYDEGATFTLAFDDSLRRTIRGFVADCNQVEIAATEGSLLMSGVDRANVYAYTMVVDASRFDTFDVAAPGYLTFFDEPLNGALEILEVADTEYESPCTLRADGQSAEFEGPDGDYGAHIPAQSRYDVSSETPPGTDAAVSDNFDGGELVVATLASHPQAIHEAADRHVADGELKYAELAAGDGTGWLTYTNEEDGSRVELECSNGSANALYSGREFYDSIRKALSIADGSIEIEWADQNPVIFAASAAGIEFNAYVAPRIPPEETSHWKDATTTEVLIR